ncbi:hypothetical protein B5P43_29125 [Bacillus sp. SRB_336]|nr:hypothetical protein B5P43_29125 [Bacillus sp. SRB_336]
MRLLPAVVASWAGAGVAIGQPWQFAAVSAACCVAVCAGAAAASWLVQAGNRRVGRQGSLAARATATVALAALCLGTVFFAVALHQHDRQTAPLAVAVAAGQELSITMEVTENPRLLSPGQGPRQVGFAAVVLQAGVHGRRLAGRLPVRVVAGLSWAHVPAGATVHTAGKVSPTGLQDRGAGILRPGTAPLEVHPARGSRPDLIFRAGWLAAAQRTWARSSPDVAGLLPGMVMGDRSASPPGLDDSMKTVGLTHLTAVSGANCTLILTVLLALLRSLHTPRLAASSFALLGLAGFVAVVGPDPSVLRAALMGGIGCAAMLSGRPKRVGALLSASIVVLLAADPWLARDYAFILSVLATLGLHLVGRRCARWLGVWMPAWLAQAVAIPLAAQLFCAPVIVLLQPRLALYTVPANMAAAPVVALVTTVGTLGMVAAPVIPAVASVCAWVAGLGVWWVAVVARWMSGLPASSVPWPDGARGAVLMAAMNAALLGALAALVERRRVSRAFHGLRDRLRPGCRFVLGFRGLTGLAAVLAALWTAAALGW